MLFVDKLNTDIDSVAYRRWREIMDDPKVHSSSTSFCKQIRESFLSLGILHGVFPAKRISVPFRGIQHIKIERTLPIRLLRESNFPIFFLFLYPMRSETPVPCRPMIHTFTYTFEHVSIARTHLGIINIIGCPVRNANGIGILRRLIPRKYTYILKMVFLNISIPLIVFDRKPSTVDVATNGEIKVIFMKQFVRPQFLTL